MEFILRPARPADAEEIMRVMHTAMAGLKDEAWFAPDDAAYIRAHIDGPEGFCLVAEAQEAGKHPLAAYFTVKLAGTAPDALGRILHMTEKELACTAQMDSCCVAPPYQGNGLEGRLLLAAEERLKAMPYRHYLATVHPDNAASLYTGLHRGYRIAAENVRCYGGKLRVVLQKDRPDDTQTKEENTV